MKLIHARAELHLITTCAVLLALIVFPMLSRTAIANANARVRGHHAKKAAHLRHKRIRPNIIAQPVTFPIPPMTLEQLPALPPRVIYGTRRLTIDSQNSAFSDVLRAVCREIGAELEMPAGIGDERAVVHVYGSTREAIRELLNGSGLNYIIMGSPENPDIVQKLILTKAAFASAVSQPVHVAPEVIQSAIIANFSPNAQQPACPQYVHKPFPADEDYELTPECANAEQKPTEEQASRQDPLNLAPPVPPPMVQTSAPPPVVRRPFPDDENFSPDP